MNIDKALELLNSAEVNCDNIKKTKSMVFADIVKAQIQMAIKDLDGEIFTDDVVANIEMGEV